VNWLFERLFFRQQLRLLVVVMVVAVVEMSVAASWTAVGVGGVLVVIVLLVTMVWRGVVRSVARGGVARVLGTPFLQRPLAGAGAPPPGPPSGGSRAVLKLAPGVRELFVLIHMVEAVIFQAAAASYAVV